MRKFLIVLFILVFVQLGQECWSNSKWSPNEGINELMLDYDKISMNSLESDRFIFFHRISTKEINDLEKIITVEKSKNNYKSACEFQLLLADYYLVKGYYSKSDNYFSDCQNYITDKTLKSTILLKRAECLISLERYLEGLEMIRQANALAYENINLEIKSNLLEAFCYIKLESYSIARKKIARVDEVSIIDSNNLVKSTILSFEALIHQNSNNFLNALKLYYKSNELLLNDSLNITSIINLVNIAEIYYQQEKFVQGVFYLNRAKGVANYLGNDNLKVRILFVLAKSYLALEEYVIAKKVLKDVDALIKNDIIQKRILQANILWLNYYNKVQSIDSAQKYFDKINLYNEPHIYNLQNEVYYAFANYYLNNKKWNQAIQSLSNISNNSYYGRKKYGLLSKCYAGISDYKMAFEYSEKARALNDSLNQQLFSLEIAQIENKLETQIKQSVINKLTHVNNIQSKTLIENKKTIDKQESKIAIFLLSLLFAFMVLLFFALWVQWNRKANRKLSIVNKKMMHQKDEIEAQSFHLIEANRELQKLSVIAQQTDNGIKIMNATGRIIWINEGYTKLHGYVLEELQSIDSFNLLGEHADIDIHKLVNVWYGDKKPISFQSLNTTKSGKKIWTQTTITPILGEDGRIDQMIAIDSDITKLKSAEEEILTKNRDITSSISYAKKIQEAMITPFDIVTKYFPKSFNFYKPKSIVSGDFYWMSVKNNKLIVACADCTGHGVPGAFMSLISISFLNKIVNEKGYTAPDVILNRLRTNIINNLHQKDGSYAAGDGLDISLITIDLSTHQMRYAGAMNPAYICRKGEFVELKPDRMPVGYFDDEEKSFTSTTLSLEKKDQIFLFTDGFYDQFGGEKGSKLKSTRFKEILKKTVNVTADKQLKTVEEGFENWKNNYPQVDDVLLIGIEIS